ncbi:MAG: winged helix-turn-helix transcriptional regulator [Deltaproteobacteria bacterium]|nr:winged helix-turn-helix transcriptional regulator [Deltaproteobacteria bacterium]
MECVRPKDGSKLLIRKVKKEFEFTPNLDELSDLMEVSGNPSRLKILALLYRYQEACVCDIADVLELTVPAISQHLGKLKSHSLIDSRREAQTIYYFLTNHPFNKRLTTVFAGLGEW